MASSTHTRENDNKRKRLTQACELCRRKKIKCDGGKPTCGNCTRLNSACTYSSSNKKRGPRQGYIEMLEQRLAKMEQILLSDSAANATPQEAESSKQEEDQDSVDHDTDTRHDDEPHASRAASAAATSTTVESIPTTTHSSIRAKSTASKRSSEDTLHDAASPASFSSLSSNFPSPPAMMNHHNHHHQQQQHPHRHNAAPQDSSNGYLLPPMNVIEHMVDLYFKYLFSGTPIFDEATLRNDIRERRCSDFLLLSLFAACARFSDRPDIREIPAWHAGEKYAEKARAMILRAVDEPTISNLQGLTLLCLHEYGCGRGPRSWMYGGMAIRMAMELGLHEDLEEDENGNDNHTLEKLMQQETRRRLFWTIYSIDKFSSAATGRPSSLQDAFCTAFLPAKVDDYSNDQYYTETLDKSRFVLLNVNGLRESQLIGSTLMSGSSHSLDSNEDPTSPSVAAATPPCRRPLLNCYAYLIRATSLLGRVTAFINSRKDQHNNVPPCHPDSEFSKLDRAIGDWYDQLPMQLKNTPANFEMYKEVNRHKNSRQFILVEPSLVLADTLGRDVVQPEIKAFIQGSVNKCMAAVDNVTLLLKEVGKYKDLMPPFITYLAYTVATVVVSSSFSSSPEEAEKAKQALGVYFQLLLSARNLWAMADKLYFMIRDLYAIHTNVLRRQLESKKAAAAAASSTQQQNQMQQPSQQQLQHIQQHQQQMQFQQEQHIQHQIQQQQQLPQQQHMLQMQIQQLGGAQIPSTLANNGLTDWMLPYNIAAMSSNTPNLDIASSQLELEFLTANTVFQIPEGYEQPLMFPSTGLNFDNTNSSSSNTNTNSGDVALDTNTNPTTTTTTSTSNDNNM
ncbi:conserved hypothetical protein [Mucor ambiguus]|uniref:Zn(2)-C6 fungal-type domain-containing protein n=1 Tax=Mucor ambiguus TaxID=91626 RepID=A0A0C9LP89_9FUNG|nr:conserved hypothetical protein [Mucor ambiguus]